MVLKYPDAKWEPLGKQTEARMRSHDIVCLHTMVGSLSGTSSMFHANGYGGTESHFGVGGTAAEGAEQWQDLMFQADANLEGGHRVWSIETADYGGVFGKWNTNDASQVPAWTDYQIDWIVDFLTWACRKETHKDCPTTWSCHKNGIPVRLIEDTKAGRRGIGYHQQGCDPVRVSGGEKWSSAYGKVCPGKRRINQLITIIIPRVQKALAGGTQEEDDMAGEGPAILAAVKALQADFNNFEILATGRFAQEVNEARAQAAAAQKRFDELMEWLMEDDSQEAVFEKLQGARWAQGVEETRTGFKQATEVLTKVETALNKGTTAETQAKE